MLFVGNFVSAYYALDCITKQEQNIRFRRVVIFSPTKLYSIIAKKSCIITIIKPQKKRKKRNVMVMLSDEVDMGF